MPASHLTVVVTRRLPEAVETRMKELFDVELRDRFMAANTAGQSEGSGTKRSMFADFYGVLRKYTLEDAVKNRGELRAVLFAARPAP